MRQLILIHNENEILTNKDDDIKLCYYSNEDDFVTEECHFFIKDKEKFYDLKMRDITIDVSKLDGSFAIEILEKVPGLVKFKNPSVKKMRISPIIDDGKNNIIFFFLNFFKTPKQISSYYERNKFVAEYCNQESEHLYKKCQIEPNIHKFFKIATLCFNNDWLFYNTTFLKDLEERIFVGEEKLNLETWERGLLKRTHIRSLRHFCLINLNMKNVSWFLRILYTSDLDLSKESFDNVVNCFKYISTEISYNDVSSILCICFRKGLDYTKERTLPLFQHPRLEMAFSSGFINGIRSIIEVSRFDSISYELYINVLVSNPDICIFGKLDDFTRRLHFLKEKYKRQLFISDDKPVYTYRVDDRMFDVGGLKHFEFRNSPSEKDEYITEVVRTILTMSENKTVEQSNGNFFLLTPKYDNVFQVLGICYTSFILSNSKKLFSIKEEISMEEE